MHYLLLHMAFLVRGNVQLCLHILRVEWYRKRFWYQVYKRQRAYARLVPVCRPEESTSFSVLVHKPTRSSHFFFNLATTAVCVCTICVAESCIRPRCKHKYRLIGLAPVGISCQKILIPPYNILDLPVSQHPRETRYTIPSMQIPHLVNSHKQAQRTTRRNNPSKES